MVRAEATAAEGLRERASRALAAVGRRVRSGSLTIERLIGMVLEGKAAELSSEEGAKADAHASSAAMKEWHDRTQAARERLGTWPLVSVLREQLGDELAYLRILAD